MAVYFITGKLGAGKTLCAVGRIQEYLFRGSPVATNLDLKLDKLINADSKNCQVLRLPDKPSVFDLQVIGKGNTTYDEGKNGGLFLDECGTWFNSRSWSDKGRQELINWMLHARKLGWDVYFIIQDISIVDKQAREALAEHVVYCKRLDRLKIPFLTTILTIVSFGLLTIRLPRIHAAIVKYGDQLNSLTVDHWVYRGTLIQSAYDTKQAFSEKIICNVSTSEGFIGSYVETPGVYQLLPPYFSHFRYRVPLNKENFVRFTKIYLKRFNRVLLFLGGIALGALVSAVVNQYFYRVISSDFVPAVHADPLPVSSPDLAADILTTDPLAETLDGYHLTIFTQRSGYNFYQFENGDGARLTSDELYQRGVRINKLSDTLLEFRQADYRYFMSL